MILKNVGVLTPSNLNRIKQSLEKTGKVDILASDIFVKVTGKEDQHVYLTAAYLGGRRWHVRAVEGLLAPV